MKPFLFSLWGGGALYNPQGTYKCHIVAKNGDSKFGQTQKGYDKGKEEYVQEVCNYPKSVLKFANENGFHPTQKPVQLISYLVRTYTNEGDLVLDNCMGSGTTAVACIKEKRNFIGFELDKGYYERSLTRIVEARKEAEHEQLSLF